MSSGCDKHSSLLKISKVHFFFFSHFNAPHLNVLFVKASCDGNYSLGNYIFGIKWQTPLSCLGKAIIVFIQNAQLPNFFTPFAQNYCFIGNDAQNQYSVCK